MTGLTSLEQDIFLHIVPYIGGGPSALLQLGLVNKFFGERPTQDEPSLVEALAREMVGIVVDMVSSDCICYCLYSHSLISLRLHIQMETMDITEEGKARIPQHEGDSLLGFYNEFLKLRKTLEFHQVVGRSEAHKARHHGNEVYSNINDGVRNSLCIMFCLYFW